MANKPWELTDNDIFRVEDESMPNAIGLLIERPLRQLMPTHINLVHAAQKKLLEYLSKTALSEEEMRFLLKEFGIGENNV